MSQKRSPEETDKAIKMLPKVMGKPSGRQDFNSLSSLVLAYEQKGTSMSTTSAYQEATRFYLDQGHQIPDSRGSTPCSHPDVGQKGAEFLPCPQRNVFPMGKPWGCRFFTL